MTINMKQFQYVVELARSGSFSKAASVLNISQPSLSQYIKKIENQLGTALFIRANGDVRLTDAGHAYLEAGKKIIATERRMENQLTDIIGYRTGTVTIGISPYRSVHLIPKVLAEFDRRYPGIRLIVKERSGKDLLDSALHGEFDLCVVALPVDEKCFCREIVQNEEIVIAVNRGTQLYRILSENSAPAEGRIFPAVDLSLVEGFDFAVLQENMPMRIATDRVLSRYGVTVHPKIELSSNEALLSVVGAGVCASFIPSGLAGGTADSTAFFSIRQDFDFRKVAVIWRKEQYLSTPMTDLISIFKAI